jgi:formylmethanofuran dehydrogenase subunit C
MTNSTLDGVQFRGGTGSDLDANIIIENNAGTQTGAWYANGNLIAKNLTATTLSATTISGGTLYSGSTNLYNIFAPINSSPYRTFVLTAGTTFSFTGTVNTVSVNKTTGSATQINLPSSPVINDYFVVKDRKGDSKINPITISGGTITIDGNVSYQMKANNNPSLTFLFDGSEYIVI